MKLVKKSVKLDEELIKQVQEKFPHKHLSDSIREALEVAVGQSKVSVGRTVSDKIESVGPTKYEDHMAWLDEQERLGLLD